MTQLLSGQSISKRKRTILYSSLLELYSRKRFQLKFHKVSKENHVAWVKVSKCLNLIRSITRNLLRFADVPSFSEPIGNVTAAIGKEVALSCTIRKVGNYKVSSRRIFARRNTARCADARGRASSSIPGR